MGNARDKIKLIADDKISPYRGENLSFVEESRYDTKYILLFLYIIIGLFILFGCKNN